MLVTLRIKGLISSVHHKQEYHLGVGCIQHGTAKCLSTISGHWWNKCEVLYEIIHICTAVVDESEMWSSQ